MTMIKDQSSDVEGAASFAALDPKDEEELLPQLVAHLREQSTKLRQEWASRIQDSNLLQAMTPQETAAETKSVYDNYVEVLETGSTEALQHYARDLSERIIPRGVETHEVVGIVLLLRDVLARSLFEKYQRDFGLLNRILDAYEPAANRIANTVAVSYGKPWTMSVSDKDSLVVARSERTPPARAERTPADKPLPPPERLALAERTQMRPRPMSADRPYHATRRISPLTRRILFFNAFALFILIGGVLWVQSSRAGLVQERIAGIRDQALIVAGALAEYTAIQERRAIDTAQAEPLLRQLIAPTHLRARVYTTGGQLQIDTRNLLARNIVVTEALPPPESTNPALAYLERGRGGHAELL